MLEELFDDFRGLGFRRRLIFAGYFFAVLFVPIDALPWGASYTLRRLSFYFLALAGMAALPDLVKLWLRTRAFLLWWGALALYLIWIFADTLLMRGATAAVFKSAAGFAFSNMVWFGIGALFASLPLLFSAALVRRLLLTALGFCLALCTAYSVIEVAWLFNVGGSELILLRLSKLFRGIALEYGWWPPDLWWFRVRSLFSEPPFLAACAVPALVVVMAEALAAGKFSKWTFPLTLGFLFLGLAFSRTGFLLAVLALVLLGVLWSVGRSGGFRSYCAVGLPILAAAGLWFFPFYCKIQYCEFGVSGIIVLSVAIFFTWFLVRRSGGWRSLWRSYRLFFCGMAVLLLAAAIWFVAVKFHVTGGSRSEFCGSGGDARLYNYDALSGRLNYVDIRNFVEVGGDLICFCRSRSEVAGIGDFDGDGKSEVLLNTASGVLRIRFPDRINSVDLPTLSPGWRVNGIGDFNGDGRMDILLRHTNGWVGVWLLMENFRPLWMELDRLPACCEVVGCGDLDGDGTDDVLFIDRIKNFLSAWLVDNGRARQWRPICEVAPAIKCFGLADFNRDGRDDVLLVTPQGDTGVISDGRWVYFGRPNAGFEVVGCSDFNQDENIEVLVRALTNGRVCFWPAVPLSHGRENKHGGMTRYISPPRQRTTLAPPKIIGGSLYTRAFMLKRELCCFAETPLAGSGAGTHSARVLDIKKDDIAALSEEFAMWKEFGKCPKINVYSAILVEFGAVGLLLFVLVFTWPLWLLAGGLYRRRPLPVRGTAAAVAFFVLVVGAGAMDIFQMFYMMFFGIAFAAALRVDFDPDEAGDGV